MAHRSNTLLLTALLTFASLGATGCAHRYREQSRDLALEHAAFSLQCSAEDIELDVLEDTRMLGALGGRMFSYGATGCGQRASYKIVCALGKCTKD